MTSIAVGMVLLCTYFAYAPEMGRSGKIELKNVETTTLFQEGDNLLVSYRFQEGKEIGFFGNSVNKYEMVNIQDLKSTCKERKK